MWKQCDDDSADDSMEENEEYFQKNRQIGQFCQNNQVSTPVL